ncbi:alpha-1A adrenergic receptor-like [Montipora foliosa]|uniref:alpha-1A adrenergic receptor-like n=1 Tax=Montipora foliosa TaxID=591990 RepID=UPI0035F21B2C
MNSTSGILGSENLALNTSNSKEVVTYCQSFSLKTTDIVFALVICSVVTVGGSFGNVVVVLVIRRTQSLKTICGALICNLAMADLLVTAILMPLIILSLVRGSVPQCSSTMSGSVFIAIGRYSTTVSLLILALLSMDRCWAIASPLGRKLRMTSSKLRNLLVFIWIVSPVIPILEAFGFRYSEFFMRVKIAGVFVCLFAIDMSGIVTVINVKHKSSKIRNLQGSERKSQVSAGLAKRDKQVAKTIALVVFLFSLCWVPILIISAIFPDRYTKLHFWTGFLSLANSALNPCIYFYRQHNYRQAFREIIRPDTLSTVLTQYKTQRNQFR